MKCEYCGIEHNGIYGSGRFCSEKCRRSFCASKRKHFPNRDVLLNRKGFGSKRKEYGYWKCDCCNEIFDTKHMLYEHKHINNHFKEKKIWNRGLTSDTSESIRKGNQKKIEGYKSGRLIHPFKGKKHSKESIEKMRSSALMSNHQRKCKKTLPYICVDGSIVNLDSSYERKLAKILDDNKIRWIRPKPLKWIDKQNRVHNYFPDFYLLDFNIYLDPKNDYCFNVQKEKISTIKKLYKNCFFLRKNDINIDFIMGLCA